jgi:hypothetical protein
MSYTHGRDLAWTACNIAIASNISVNKGMAGLGYLTPWSNCVHWGYKACLGMLNLHVCKVGLPWW